MKAFHHAPLTEVEKSKIRKLYAEGLKSNQLCERFGRTKETIRAIVREKEPK